MAYSKIIDSMADNNLPTMDVFLETLSYLDNPKITLEEVLIVKQDFMSSGQKIIKLYREYVKDMIGLGVQELLDSLSNFNTIFSAFIGIGETISDKIEVLTYIELTENAKKIDTVGKTGKLSLSQGDRDKFSKEKVAALEGFITVLKAMQAEVKTKSGIINPTKPKY